MSLLPSSILSVIISMSPLLVQYTERQPQYGRAAYQCTECQPQYAPSAYHRLSANLGTGRLFVQYTACGHCAYIEEALY